MCAGNIFHWLLCHDNRHAILDAERLLLLLLIPCPFPSPSSTAILLHFTLPPHRLSFSSPNPRSLRRRIPSAKLDMYAIWDIQATAAQNTAIDNSLLTITFTFAICYRPSVCRLSVVCNVRAPYSGGSNFRQYFYGIRYLGHPFTFTENFTEIVPGEPLPPGELNTRGVVKYSDFGSIDGYISETVQYRR